jgi:hypothetical protein
MLHSYENRTWRTERRARWPRILGWIINAGLFALLMLLTFNMEFLLKLAKEYQS